MKKIVFTFFLIYFLGVPIAQAEWDKYDTSLMITSNLLLIIDWSQTRYIVKHPERFSEENPILGRHPSIGKVNTYFITSILVNSAVGYILPNPYRKYWFGIISGIELYTIGKNINCGVRFNLP